VKKNLFALTAFFAVGAILLSACSGGSDSGSASTSTDSGSTSTESTQEAAAELAGTILMDGSSTVAPLTEAAAELFMNENNKVRVTVATSGTGGGFAKFCLGETDGNSASRPIKDSEIEECEKNGIAYAGVQVANDALSILVNNDFPIDCMTVDQVSQLWNEGSTVKTWGQVTGLAWPADFANREVKLYGPGTDSGTFDFFTEVINGKSGQITTSYIDIGEDDNAAVVAIQSDVTAMGYVPYSYYQEAGDKVKALQIDGGAGCIEATIDNVLTGVYTPLGRPLFVYASDTALQRPEVVAFFEFYVNNSSVIAAAAGAVGMNEAQTAKSLADVAALAQ
jgi:phosphate transport system substrate-binding protein